MHVVTGGAGFLGSALIRALNGQGITDILVVDNLGKSEKWRNLVKACYSDYMHRDRFLELARAGSLPFPLASITHLGACSSTTERDSDFLMENNFHYSQIVCRCALRHGARFINASSAATYGAGEHGFGDAVELLPRLRPLNMYGYSKHLFDLWLLREGLEQKVASLKFFNVYGPNEYHKGEMMSVAARLWRQIGEEGRAVLFASARADVADGEQKRDFVYVKDCAALMAWLLLDGRAQNGICNVGSGRARTFNEVAKAVFAAMERPCEIVYKPTPADIAPSYQYFTEADMGWLGRSGCPVEFRALEAGIADYARNYLASGDKYL